MGYSSQGPKESDTTERLHFPFHFSMFAMLDSRFSACALGLVVCDSL